MIQEQKELLLQDLCARVPYGVRLLVNSHKGIFCGTLVTVSTKLSNTLGEAWIKETDEALWCDYKLFKPYLFPLSSMTEEQYKEFYDKYCWSDGGDGFEMDSCSHYYALEKINWCLKNHFDIYSLIPMDLAIDATGKNIY